MKIVKRNKNKQSLISYLITKPHAEQGEDEAVNMTELRYEPEIDNYSVWHYLKADNAYIRLNDEATEIMTSQEVENMVTATRFDKSARILKITEF